MKYILLLCIAVGFMACNQRTPKKEPTAEELSFRKRYVDSMTTVLAEGAINKAYFDTSNQVNSPIKILSFKVVKSESGNYRNVYLRYTNTSNKTISAIRFRWHGVNAFGEPADLGNYSARGFGGGFTDDVLRPGKSDDGTWSILSRDAKKLTKAWATEVVFTDDTKWTSND
jgi:hypothetical protein